MSCELIRFFHQLYPLAQAGSLDYIENWFYFFNCLLVS